MNRPLLRSDQEGMLLNSENRENMNTDKNRLCRTRTFKKAGARHGDQHGWNCPLCMERVDDQDVDFTPCECGYQICRFCWNHIKSVLNNQCPACRKTYENEPMVRVPREDRRKEDTPKTRGGVPLGSVLSHRKHLVDLRVLQPNLVYVIGIPLSLDCYNTTSVQAPSSNSVSHLEELLASQEYFGQYGKLVKLVINLKGQHLTNPIVRKSDQHDAGKYSKKPVATVSAFLTFEKKEEASEAIRRIDETTIDGFPLRATYGTTKYCAFFLRGQSCPNQSHCLYLHELGEEINSYTKEALSARQRDSRLKKEFEKTVQHPDKRSEKYPSPPGLSIHPAFASGMFTLSGATYWTGTPQKDDPKRLNISAIGTLSPSDRNRLYFDPLDPSNDIQKSSPELRGRTTSRFGFASQGLDEESPSREPENPFVLKESRDRPVDELDSLLDLGVLEKELDNANKEAKRLEDRLAALMQRNRAHIYIE